MAAADDRGSRDGAPGGGPGGLLQPAWAHRGMAPDSQKRLPGEEHQHQTGERLQRAIALDVVLAWRIQLLVLLGRPVPELPGEIFFDNWEVKVLEAVQQQKRPDTRGQGGAFRCGGDQISEK